MLGDSYTGILTYPDPGDVEGWFFHSKSWRAATDAELYAILPWLDSSIYGET